MKKATNIKNGNVNIKCEYCGGCGYHKMSCPTQKVTVFMSEANKQSGQRLTKPTKKSTNNLT